MYEGIFKAHYPVLQGRDWIRNISTEDIYHEAQRLYYEYDAGRFPTIQEYIGDDD